MATLTQTFDARVRLLTAVLDEALTVLGAKWVRWSADGVTVSAVVHWSFFNRGERLTVDVAKSGKIAVQSENIDTFKKYSLFGDRSAETNRRNCADLLDAVEDCLDERVHASR